MPLKSFTFTFPQLSAQGRLRVMPLQQVVDGSNIYLANIDVATSSVAANGAVSVSLPIPAAGEYAYRFTLERGTAAPFTTVDYFDRGISANSPTDGSQLIDQFFAQDLSDLSLYAIAEYLKPAVLNQVGTVSPLPWNSATTYKSGDKVSTGARWWQYINAAQSANKNPEDPVNSAFWTKILEAPAGTGTTTSDRAYSDATFTNLLTEPASRKNLVELKALIAAPDLSGYAQRDVANTWTKKQTFGAGASGVTANLGMNNTDLATNAFVQAAIAAISGATALPEPAAWTRRSANYSGLYNNEIKIVWDSTVKGTVNNGNIAIPSAGLYLMICQLWFRLQSTFSAAGGRLNFRAPVYQNGTTPIGEIVQAGTNEMNGSTDFKMTGARLFSASANDTIDVRIVASGTNIQGSPDGVLVGNVNNNFVILFKVAG
jgi:hypothetical protein